MRKYVYWSLLGIAWILLTPGILLSIPGWVIWMIAKSISPANLVRKSFEERNR